MSQQIQNIHFVHQKDIDQIDNDVYEEVSMYQQGPQSEKKCIEIILESIFQLLKQAENKQANQLGTKVNQKRINFLKAKDLTYIDDDVIDDIQFEQDQTAKTQISEKVLRKIDQLKLETIESVEMYSSNVNQSLQNDIEYYKKLQVKSAIELIDKVEQKESIADDMIQANDQGPNSTSKNFRNAWIVNTVEKKYNNSGSQTCIENNKGEPILAANMMKFTGGIINKWKQVRCELHEEYFQIFSEKEGGDKQKYLLTDSLNYKTFQISVEIATEEKENIKELVLKLLYSNYVLRLRELPNSNVSLKQWMEKIQARIRGLWDIQKYKLDEEKMPFVTLNETIMESEFVEKAKSGDIVLFNTDSVAASMQRKTTFSKYDHVGIVIRLRDNLVRIFDATGDGVELTEWNKFVYQNGQYKTITYRQLNYSKREKVLPALYNFVMSANGKKYSLNLFKFAKMNSVVGDDSTKNKDSTYFCSELVAKCYKEMGLLNQITSSTQYWPRSFSTEYDDKELVLYDNAYLGPEQTILLDVDILKVKNTNK